MRKGCSQITTKVPVAVGKTATRALSFILLVLALTQPVAAQGQVSGFMPINRLGLSYQKAMGLDLGLGAYSVLFGRQQAHFFDASVGVEGIFAKPFLLVPKVNVDMGFAIPALGDLTFGGGADLGWVTGFSESGLRFTPKIGVTAASVIRLYYGYHTYSPIAVAQATGRHRISLEINIAAFHDFKLGI